MSSVMPATIAPSHADDLGALALSLSRKVERLTATLKIVAEQAESAAALACGQREFWLAFASGQASLCRSQLAACESGRYRGPKPY